jgi:lipopolysaccharide transport system permease protein
MFPARSVLASALVFSPLMGLLWVAYWPLHQSLLTLPALALMWVLQTALVYVMVLALAILAAALRDITQLVAFALQVGIFLSPALFPYAQFPADWRWALWANPMTPFLLGYQSVLLQGAWPEASVWSGIVAWVAVFGGLAHVLHARSKDQLVDWL